MLPYEQLGSENHDCRCNTRITFSQSTTDLNFLCSQLCGSEKTLNLKPLFARLGLTAITFGPTAADFLAKSPSQL